MHRVFLSLSKESSHLGLCKILKNQKKSQLPRAASPSVTFLPLLDKCHLLLIVLNGDTYTKLERQNLDS